MESSLSRRSSMSVATVDLESYKEDTAGQGGHFLSLYQKCQDLHEILLCLKYESEFCSEYRCKPIHRYYFCSVSNPSEQFYTFSCLAGWLIKSKNVESLVPAGDKSSFVSAISSLNPQDYEDPNVTITGILDVIRLLKGQEEVASKNNEKLSIDFPPAKLKQGSGGEVINVLLILAKAALQASISVTSHSTVHVENLTNESTNTGDGDAFGMADDDDDIEMNMEESHFLLQGEEEDDEETNLFVDSFSPAAISSKASSLYASNVQSDILISQIDQAAWSQEVERVLPQLKVSLSTDSRSLTSAATSISDKNDWRIRLTQLTSKSGEMNDIFTSTLDLMGKIGKEIKSTQVSLESREKYLSTQFDGLIKEYILIKEQLDSLESKYNSASIGITEKTKELSLISDELESIKNDMEERGAKMTDGGPLVSLRKSLASLKSELITIEIRIGVASHSILQYCMKDSMAQMAIKKGSSYTLGEGEGILYNSQSTLPYTEVTATSFL